jgi:3-isopropylmalate/(R)-2-methylmalate dehydratase small subunit
METTEQETFKGRVWKFGDNINTDMMMPNTARTLPELDQKKYVFESIRPGWSALVEPGDIIVGGKNFGTGSSRPAAKLLRQLGIVAVIAESVNGLFLRNCVNYGVVPLSCEGVEAAFDEGDIATVNVRGARVGNAGTRRLLETKELPEQLIQLVLAGGIRPLLKRRGFLK